MKEALFYRKLEGGKVRCELCPHNCAIALGKRGICGVRENHQGVLYSLVYGKVVSAHVDPIEKKPFFHFLPGSYSYSISTVGCNFRCLFCQNWEISQMPREYHQIVGQNMTPEEVVAEALENTCQSISYTYTEPTIFFEFAYDCAKLAQSKGLKNNFVTNGYTNLPAIEMIAPYLDAANVDLKSFREEYYLKICGGRLAPVLETLKFMRKLNIWVEVTTLVIPGLNDSKEELKDIANFIKNELGDDVPWHISAFYPHYKMLDRPPTPAQTLVKAREIGIGVGLKYVYTGNIPIPGAEDTYCPACHKPLIVRSGFSVLENKVKDGKCSYCGVEVSGVWGDQP
ncbi:MAG: AmmeMemoRadiSam system radical SAM enzyme [Candidatus Margulisiibacteriota bacterium]